jgi:hypothetical protein
MSTAATFCAIQEWPILKSVTEAMEENRMARPGFKSPWFGALVAVCASPLGLVAPT